MKYANRDNRHISDEYRALIRARIVDFPGHFPPCRLPTTVLVMNATNPEMSHNAGVTNDELIHLRFVEEIRQRLS